MHHCKESENYGFHVLHIGKSDFCIGCFANIIFLSFLLPIYISVITSELNPLVQTLILGYVIFQFWKVGASVLLGRNPESLVSTLFTTIYLIVVHWIIIFGRIRIEIPELTLLLMILTFSLPQVTMYLWKIAASQEFKFPRSKLLIRICFIHGYLFALLYARQDPIVGIVVVLTAAGIFVLLRAGAIRKVNRNSISGLKPAPRNFDEDVTPSTRVSRKGVFGASIAMLLAEPGKSKEDTCIDSICCSEICCCSSEICCCCISTLAG